MYAFPIYIRLFLSIICESSVLEGWVGGLYWNGGWSVLDGWVSGLYIGAVGGCLVKTNTNIKVLYVYFKFLNLLYETLAWLALAEHSDLLLNVTILLRL